MLFIPFTNKSDLKFKTVRGTSIVEAVDSPVPLIWIRKIIQPTTQLWLWQKNIIDVQRYSKQKHWVPKKFNQTTLWTFTSKNFIPKNTKKNSKFSSSVQKRKFLNSKFFLKNVQKKLHGLNLIKFLLYNLQSKNPEVHRHRKQRNQNSKENLSIDN